MRANQLYDRKAKLDASKQDSALSEGERDELTQSRRENKALRIEQEILKKPLILKTIEQRPLCVSLARRLAYKVPTKRIHSDKVP
jgi:hypothetical protein